MSDELDYQVSRCEPVEAFGGGYGCPFHQSDTCTHAGAPEELAQGISEVLDREVGPGSFGNIPSRCPMRAHPVHVRLHSRLVMVRPKDFTEQHEDLVPNDETTAVGETDLVYADD